MNQIESRKAERRTYKGMRRDALMTVPVERRAFKYGERRILRRRRS